MKRIFHALFFLGVLTCIAGCTGNDDVTFKSLVEQLNQKGVQIKSTINNPDGSINKPVAEDMIKTYQEARSKMSSMKLSDTYAGARDNYIKGIDEATAGYSSLLNVDTSKPLGTLANAGSAMGKFSSAQGYFDSAKRMIGITVT